MFDASKSNLFEPIMKAFAAFFSLSDTATETEIHAAIADAKPLAEQLETARAEAVAAQTAMLADIQARLTVMEETQAALTQSIADKDQAIATLEETILARQTEIETAQTEIATIKAANTATVTALAGQISALKAGRQIDPNPPGEPHAAAVLVDQPSGANKQIPIASSALSDLVKKVQRN